MIELSLLKMTNQIWTVLLETGTILKLAPKSVDVFPARCKVLAAPTTILC